MYLIIFNLDNSIKQWALNNMQRALTQRGEEVRESKLSDYIAALNPHEGPQVNNPLTLGMLASPERSY
jgi:hypothetical protein